MMKEQIKREYNDKLMDIDPEDLCLEAKKHSLGQKHASKNGCYKNGKKFKDSDQSLDKAIEINNKYNIFLYYQEFFPIMS